MSKRSIDLHGMTAVQAKSVLLREVRNCPANVTELEVIHGFHSGQTLIQMVRRFSHPKVSRKILGLNNGVTVFLMKRD